MLRKFPRQIGAKRMYYPNVKTADEKILRAFTTYPYLTSEQLTRLLYRKGSAHYVSAKLKSLTKQKLLHRLERETINFPYVYCLGIRGIRYRQALGCDIALFHPSEHTTHKPLFVHHTLAVNDFLIAAATLPTIAPAISVHDIKHDLTLKHTRTPVIPDGWIDFRLNEKTQLCIWLEMDMGTMDQKPIRKKISSLIDFSRQSYEQVFGTPSLTIVFATTAGQGQVRATWQSVSTSQMAESPCRDVTPGVYLPAAMMLCAIHSLLAIAETQKEIPS